MNSNDTLRCACVPRFRSCPILTSSVIYNWTDLGQHEICLLNWTEVREIKRTKCFSGFMSIIDVLKTYQNITSGLQHQILLIYYTLNKTLLTKTVLSLNWSFKKLKWNDAIRKRYLREEKVLRNITNRLTSNTTYSPND